MATAHMTAQVGYDPVADELEVTFGSTPGPVGVAEPAEDLLVMFDASEPGRCVYVSAAGASTRPSWWIGMLSDLVGTSVTAEWEKIRVDRGQVRDQQVRLSQTEADALEAVWRAVYTQHVAPFELDEPQPAWPERFRGWLDSWLASPSWSVQLPRAVPALEGARAAPPAVIEEVERREIPDWVARPLRLGVTSIALRLLDPQRVECRIEPDEGLPPGGLAVRLHRSHEISAAFEWDEQQPGSAVAVLELAEPIEHEDLQVLEVELGPAGVGGSTNDTDGGM